MIEKRYRAACVILNHQKTAWIVGGEGSAYAKTTTEFVTLNKTSVRGPDLSFEVYLPTFFNHHTLQKKEDLGQLKNREKCFKICYIYGKRKPT